MNPQSRDPWRLGVLDRLGAQLRELERADAARRRRRRVSISGGLVAALVAAFALLDMGQLARALSPINRAPAAAAASESVRFHSTITIAVSGQPAGAVHRARRNRLRTTELPHDAPVGSRRSDRAASRRRRLLHRATSRWAQSTCADPVARGSRSPTKPPPRSRQRLKARSSRVPWCCWTSLAAPALPSRS